MNDYSRHRHWHTEPRPAVFTDTPTAERGALVFSTVPMPGQLVQQLAAGIEDGAAYVDGHHPVVRGKGGVYVTEAAQWFGQQLVTRAGAEHCAQVWAWLQRSVQHHWRDTELQLLATPGTTGRDLWLRTIGPRERGYLLLDDELQQLVRATAHQARVEVLPAPAGGELPALIEYDMRLAYMAAARDMPTGRPVWRHNLQPDTSTLAQPVRWWVDFTPPAGWQLPGILPVMREAGGWHYPTAGTHTTVADGAELQLAVQHGWQVSVQRALVWPERCQPYRTLFDRLLAILMDSRRHSELTQAMVRAAVRSMALHTIGAMHGTPHRVSRHGSAADVPAEAEQLRIEADGSARWVELQPGAWPGTAHPEWTAHLWARVRRRLLLTPGGGGMLTLPAGSVVAVRTDAVYLTAHAGWDAHDDGKPGRWVLKRQRTGPMPWPASHSELLRTRDAVAV